MIATTFTCQHCAALALGPKQRQIASALLPMVCMLEMTVVVRSCMYLLTRSWVLCADISSRCSQHMYLGSDRLHDQARCAAMAGMVCHFIQQPENAVAFSHAAVQCASFQHGHGKFVSGCELDKGNLVVHMHMMKYVLLDHLVQYSKPGGYSAQSFRMIVDFCVSEKGSPAHMLEKTIHAM